MSYKHGIFSAEVPTSITPPVIIEGNSGLCLAIGTAPSHLAVNAAKPNTPILAYNYKEAVQQLGYSEDFDKYTLCEVMSSFYLLYNVAPVVFVNVFDENKHCEKKFFEVAGISSTPANIGTEGVPSKGFKVTSGEDIAPVNLVNGSDYCLSTDDDTSDTVISILDVSKIENGIVNYGYLTIDDTEIKSTSTVRAGTAIPLDSDAKVSTLTVTSGGSVKQTLTEDEDYHVGRDSDGSLIVTLITDTKVVDDTITIEYYEADPSKVTIFDVIGGIDTLTGEVSGLELVEYIYPRLGVLPGIIIAPKFSTNSAVAAVMKAKAKLVNETFKATAIADIDTEEALSYTQAAEVKAKRNLADTSLMVCYPKVSLGGVQYHLSTQMAALMNQVDAGNGGIPYVSPSNHNLQADSTVRKDGTEIYMSLPQANYLNGNGIVTGLNFAGSFKLWGNRTSAYPHDSDIKNNFIPIRRVFNYISNSLIISFWSRIDNPLNRRLIESIVTSANIWLDSLTAAGVILGGRVEFTSEDNTTADLMNGIIHFHLYLTPPPPAKEISFIQEFDTNYLATLFE